MPKSGGVVANEFIIVGSKEAIVKGKEIQQRVWDEDPFTQFTGLGTDNCVIAIGETAKEGTQVSVPFLSDLRGSDARGNQNLDEADDDFDLLYFGFKGDLLAKPVVSPNKKLMTRAMLNDLRKKFKPGLEMYMKTKTVKEKFYTISHNPTNLVIVKQNGDVKKETADLAVGDTFNTYVLDEMLKRAKNGWTDDDGVKHPKIRPFTVKKTSVDGIVQSKKVYPIFVGPESYDALCRDPRWISEQANKANQGISTAVNGFAGVYKQAVIIEWGANDSQDPGIIRSDSPDFIGLSGTYTGFSSYKAGDDTVTELNFLLGAGALGLAFDKEPEYAEDNNYDSGRKIRFFMEQFFGAKKIRWQGETPKEQESIYHDKDYGVIVAPSTVK